MPFVMLSRASLEVIYPNLVAIYVEKYYRIISLHDEVSIIAISKNN